MEAVIILELRFELGNSREKCLLFYTFSWIPGWPMIIKIYAFNYAQVETSRFSVLPQSQSNRVLPRLLS